MGQVRKVSLNLAGPGSLLAASPSYQPPRGCSLPDFHVFPLSWKDNPAMPDGLIYEGVSDEPMAYSGGSAAQSTILHAFDELLGIRHSEESSKSHTFSFSQANKEQGKNRARAFPTAVGRLYVAVDRTRAHLALAKPSQIPAATRLCPVH